MWFSRRESLGRMGAAIILLILFTSPLFGKRKDDVIVMKNGDRFTGEIKGMHHGELSFKSSYMKDSMSVNWQDVAFVSSADHFIVTLTSGEKITGALKTASQSHGDIKEIELSVEDQVRNVKQPTVIGLEQRETNFWSQLEGSVNLGFTYASGNSTADLSTAMSTTYKTQKYQVSVSASSQYSRSSAESTDRHQLTNQNSRMLSSNWFTQSYIDLLKSDQQQLSLRSTWGGGIGRNIIQTPLTSLKASFGGVYTRERYTEVSSGEPVKGSGELLLGVSYSTFRFGTADVSSEVFFFPSVTDAGRLRISTQTNLNFELVRNLVWNFRVYENFDSRPPVEAPRNDTGVTTSLGFRF